VQNKKEPSGSFLFEDGKSGEAAGCPRGLEIESSGEAIDI
jgi:hypothetical protein